MVFFNMYGTCLHLIFMLIFLESYILNLLESLASDSKDIGNIVTSHKKRDGTYRWELKNEVRVFSFS